MYPRQIIKTENQGKTIELCCKSIFFYFYTPASSKVCIAISLSVSPSVPHFGNISQMAQTISIIFCMQLLFRMRRDDTKFRFGLKTMKGFFREGYGGLHLKMSIFFIYCSIFLKFGTIFLTVNVYE